MRAVVVFAAVCAVVAVAAATAATPVAPLVDAVRAKEGGAQVETIRALVQLEEMVHDLEHARLLAKDGLGDVVALLDGKQAPQILQLALWVIGSGAQNNPHFQTAVAAAGGVERLARVLASEAFVDEASLGKALYASSALLRGNAEGQVAFAEAGGFNALCNLRFPLGSKLPARVMTLLDDLRDEHAVAADAMPVPCGVAAQQVVKAASAEVERRREAEAAERMEAQRRRLAQALAEREKARAELEAEVQRQETQRQEAAKKAEDERWDRAYADLAKRQQADAAARLQHKQEEKERLEKERLEQEEARSQQHVEQQQELERRQELVRQQQAAQHSQSMEALQQQQVQQQQRLAQLQEQERQSLLRKQERERHGEHEDRSWFGQQRRQRRPSLLDQFLRPSPRFASW